MNRAAWPLLAGAVLACLCGAAAAARIYQYEDVKAGYVDQISHAITCGTWRHGNESGTYRVLEAVVYTQSILFVQWLGAPDPDTGLRTVRASYGPAALNNDHADVTLSALRCHARSSGIRVTARAYSGHDHRWRSLRLLASHEPGVAHLQLRLDPEPQSGDNERGARLR